jgi:hypothetical protein
MHDGASVHRAHIITNLLQDIIQRLDVTIMIWPLYLPDLNPIENLWALIKAEIYRLHPESEHAPDTEKTKETLAEAAKEAWRNIDSDILYRISATATPCKGCQRGRWVLYKNIKMLQLQNQKRPALAFPICSPNGKIRCMA